MRKSGVTYSDANVEHEDIIEPFVPNWVEPGGAAEREIVLRYAQIEEMRGKPFDASSATAFLLFLEQEYDDFNGDKESEEGLTLLSDVDDETVQRFIDTYMGRFRTWMDFAYDMDERHNYAKIMQEALDNAGLPAPLDTAIIDWDQLSLRLEIAYDAIEDSKGRLHIFLNV